MTTMSVHQKSFVTIVHVKIHSYDVKITIRELKKTIKSLLENEWSNYRRDALSPSKNDREAIEKMSLKTIDGEEEELSAHLMDAERAETDEEIFGPVAPHKGEVTFYAMTDPFSQHWNILPSSPPR